jgi:hypothetical protein
MKEMKRFRKNGNAQNLFNTSISFIVLMVVVSIAVNVLIETHAKQPPLIEELKITGVTFSKSNTINVVVNNSGTLDFEIAEVWINNEKQAFTINSPTETVLPSASVHVLVTCPYSNGTNYNIKVVSNRGNVYLASASTF